MIYVAGTYNNAKDRNLHMEAIMKHMGDFMKKNPEAHLISPLMHHYTLIHHPDMPTSYQYWRAFSRNLLKRCDELLVLRSEGWEESGGVQDELNYARELGIPIHYEDLIY